MKTRREVVETNDAGTRLALHEVEIGGVFYTVRITNLGGGVQISFAEAGRLGSIVADEFTINVARGRVNLHRHVYRPHHDHDDDQYACVSTLPGESGKVHWLRNPVKEGSFALLDLEFGAVTVGY